MNQDLPFRDAFAQDFRRESDFLSFLLERDANGQWLREKSSEIRFVALEEGAPTTETLMRHYRSYNSEEILNDTMTNTRLLMQAFERYYPVRSCAIKTILDRARIAGNALKKVSKPELAEILNICMKVAQGNALMLYSYGKVSALHGGDPSDYSVLPLPELFQRTAEYLRKEHGEISFAGGSYDHCTVSAIWELKECDELIEVYQELLEKNGYPRRDMKPAVRLTSSDVGMSGANLFPMLLHDSGNRILELSHSLKLEHNNGATLDDFDEKLKKIYAQYELALRGLTELLGIYIDYPVNTMIGVLKSHKFGKKMSMQVVDLFKKQYGETPCTAHDIYYGINEMVFLLQCDGASGARIAQMEEKVASVLTCNWKKYDMPGDIKW